MKERTRVVSVKEQVDVGNDHAVSARRLFWRKASTSRSSASLLRSAGSKPGRRSSGLALTDERGAARLPRASSQSSADGLVERFLEAAAGTVCGLTQQPFHVFVQSHRGSHLESMMPDPLAVKVCGRSDSRRGPGLGRVKAKAEKLKLNSRGGLPAKDAKDAKQGQADTPGRLMAKC